MVRRLLPVLAAVLLLPALSGCERSTPDRSSNQGQPATATPVAGTADIVRRVEPSIVTVYVGQGLGSGIVYRDNGVIVTNQHVVGDTKQVTVAFADGQRVSGEVLATDPVSDLAVVRVPRNGLPAARFETTLPPVGALVNGNAAVIGVNEAYLPPSTGAVSLGFAIPAATVVDQLLRSGRAQHAYLGIQPAPLTPDIAQELGVDQTEGVGDIIVSIGGTPTPTVSDLYAALRRHEPGEKVEVRVLRGGDEQTVTVTLGDRPS